MRKSISLIVIIVLSCNYTAAQLIHYENTDPRLVSNGNELPSLNYADQPRIIICNDGSWLAVLTTSSGSEHVYMNYIISAKSYNQGETWTDPVNVEPPGVPQSSWAVPLKVPSGRIYVFYNYNKYKLSGQVGVYSDPFAYKYSDDHGRTWSEKRFEVPIRKTKIDDENHTSGKRQFFWSTGKPVVTDEAAYIPFTKRKTDQDGDFTISEGFILKSSNILNEENPEQIAWETLPEGETGIVNPEFGMVQAEHNLAVLNNEGLYIVYRTWDGAPAYAISTDGGKTFSKPTYMHYANGEPMGNPRAFPRIYKTREGKYLFWYHNNFRKKTHSGRNPAWLAGGIEKDGNIEWSQPEVVIYSRDPGLFGMSYPDFVEQQGRLWIVETQKTEARIHEISPNLLQGLWRQGIDSSLVEEGLVMNADVSMLAPKKISFPQLPSLINGGGFTIELWLTIDVLQANQQILSTVGAKSKGIEISLAANNAIEISVSDGEVRDIDMSTSSTFTSDQNSLSEGQLHHVVFTLDGAANIATVIVDGVLSDGGLQTREYGWGRIYPYLRDVNDTNIASLSEKFEGKIHYVRVYDRALRTSEAIANYNAGLDENSLKHKGDR